MAQRGRPRKFDRDEALAKATHLFWERGFDGTTIVNLEQTLALNPPSIYAAFGSKEDLFRESVHQYLKNEGAIIADAMDSADSAHDAVTAMLMTSAREFTKVGRPKGCMVVLDALHDHEVTSSVNSLLKTLRLANIKRLGAKFEADVAAGVLPGNRDWESIAVFFVTVQQGMAIRARDGASREAMTAVANCALDAWPSLSSK